MSCLSNPYAWDFENLQLLNFISGNFPEAIYIIQDEEKFWYNIIWIHFSINWYHASLPSDNAPFDLTIYRP